MIWLDWVLLAVLAMSAFAGMRLGLLWSVVAGGGFLLAWLFAGNISSAASVGVQAYTDSPTALAVVSVLIYLILLGVVLYSVNRLVAAIRTLLSTATFGASSMLDKVGGLLLGLVVGAMVIGAVILVGARLTYQLDYDEVDLDVPGQVEARVELGENVREDLEGLLASSEVVGVLVSIATALPADTLGLAPTYFGDSLELLNRALD